MSLRDVGGWVAAWALVIGFVLVIVVVGIGVRYLMAGGEWSCVMSSDPALCATLAGVGK